MSRLLRVELTRLLCRRAVLVILVLAVAVPTVIGVATVLNTRPPSADDLAFAEAEAERESERKVYQRQFEDCLENPEMYLGEEVTGDVRAACEESAIPQPEWFVYWEPLELERSATTAQASRS